MRSWLGQLHWHKPVRPAPMISQWPRCHRLHASPHRIASRLRRAAAGRMHHPAVAGRMSSLSSAACRLRHWVAPTAPCHRSIPHELRMHHRKKQNLGEEVSYVIYPGACDPKFPCSRIRLSLPAQSHAEKKETISRLDSRRKRCTFRVPSMLAQIAVSTMGTSFSPAWMPSLWIPTITEQEFKINLIHAMRFSRQFII